MYVSVRWLSLERAVYRILQLYNSLQSYFKSESESQARLKKLVVAFEEPMTEMYLLFYESVLCTFTHVNLFLQREDPSIYLVDDAIRAFLKKLLSKFVTLQAIREQDDITKLDFTNPVNHLSDHAITIGMVTKQHLQKLLNEVALVPIMKGSSMQEYELFIFMLLLKLYTSCPSMTVTSTMQYS